MLIFTTQHTKQGVFQLSINQIEPTFENLLQNHIIPFLSSNAYSKLFAQKR